MNMLPTLALPTLAALLTARPPVPRAAVRACDTIEMAPSGESSSTSQFSVYLMNDGFNMREYVARVLMMVCYIDETQAEGVMLEANWNRIARIGTWERPLAQHMRDGLIKAGLHASMSPAEPPADAPADAPADEAE